jgi:hypothetical protein
VSDVLVSEVVLQRPGIVALIGELQAAGVAQHMRMDWERKLRLHTRSGDQFADVAGGHRAANIEKMTEAKHVASLNPPRISLFPGEFFNNIGRVLSFRRERP